jgi:hypothetical protein
MAKTKKSSKTARTTRADNDGAYFLKLVLYLIVGSQWLWLTTSSGSKVPLPIGLAVGLIFARQDHFQIDRKIEYAILLVATLVGFWAQIGLLWNL